MTCPSEEDLAAFAGGTLAAQQRHHIEVHFDECGECRMLTADLLRGANAAPRPTQSKPTIGRFSIIETLGAGAMGVVYLARDPALKRKVAVKLMRLGVGSDEEQSKARMMREARTMAQLNHENVVTVHEVGLHGDSVFIAMEYVAGQTLKDWLCQQPPWREVLEVFFKAGAGLCAAHERGLVHRDFKPDNVLLGEDGRVRVSDFGLARSDGAFVEMTGDTSLGRPVTQAGHLLGTPAYMAPEQWDGTDVTPAADQFAFAVALYEGLYGARPTDPTRPEIIRKPPPSDVPAAVFETLARALNENPGARFAGVDALLEQLSLAAFPRSNSDASPYIGLSAFDEGDAPLFFGRSREIETVLHKLESSPMVTVVGQSGAGKSSLVRAGVLPAYRKKYPDAAVTVVRLGRQPLTALTELGANPVNEQKWAESIAKGGRRILYFDQFEELYALTDDEHIHRTIGDAIVAASKITNIDVVVSLRSDFLDKAAGHRRLAEALSAGVVVLGSPDRDTLRDALVEPAIYRGYHFESTALVESIVRELDGTPGALPLLQFAADKLWDTRDVEQRTITEAGYQSIGTFAGALAAHADQVLAGLGHADRETAKTLFRRLVTGSETRDLVATSEIEEVIGAAKAQRLLDYFAANRLIVLSKDDRDAVVSLSHESLIDRWPTLRRWIDEAGEFASTLGELRSAARIWQNRGRPADLAWKGPSLEELKVALRRSAPKLTEIEQSFVAASSQQAARSAWRRRALVVGTFSMLAAVAIVATVAFFQVRSAQERANREANAKALVAEKAKAAERSAKAAEAEARASLEQVKRERKNRVAAESKADEALENVQERDRKLKMTYAELESALRKAKRAANSEREAKVALEKERDRALRDLDEARKNQRDRATVLKQ